jgi:DNA-binding IclR family transcriptional regulator
MQGPTRTKSLVRAVEVLRAVTSSNGNCTPASIAKAIGVPRSTVYRLLATLESVGLVEPTGEGTWVVGYELVRLGRHADLSRALVPRAQPLLEGLVSACGETAMLTLPRGAFDVDVVSQVDAPNLLGMTSWVGRPIQMHASAAGKLLLAELSPQERARYCSSIALTRLTGRTITEPEALERELQTVAAQGYAETIDELEEGLGGIVAPVRDDPGGLVAMIGIYGPSSRVFGDTRDATTRAVVDAAQRLSREL